MEYDCQRCGACCCNTNENREEDFIYYVEVDPRSPLLKKAALKARYVMEDPEGNPHMRLREDGSCVALVGSPGERVGCGIYLQRPRGCRRVEPGDRACLTARYERFGWGPRVG